ncbi:HTH domain-containing protein [Bremerella sp. JC817]|uniref:HTH domain-containing protein n=1 Tax=Bremerella sp. JC817 TaxID=3231756 RepID=UPI00345A31B2
MTDLGWREAIVKVLQDAGEPMHYTEIAEAIADQELRTDFGANPATSVNSTISQSLQNDADSSLFIRVARGQYYLRNPPERLPATGTELNDIVEAASEETGLINAFGMYWARDKVLWKSTPQIFGQQQPGSTPVDFTGQKGVYLLHDARDVVYVGRTTEQPLGVRLKQHTTDRLNGRWDRFSWFGVFDVTEDGTLLGEHSERFSLENLIVTMEALLIEGLEPPQNRKRGDDFRAVEFLQVEDPELEKSHILKLMDELKKKL